MQLRLAIKFSKLLTAFNLILFHFVNVEKFKQKPKYTEKLCV
jgi:hypothetical protein